jgi:predicted RecB family nuclease
VRIVNSRIRLAASDVANFLACRHLTRLDLLHARGMLTPPQPFDAGFQDLVRRGDAHEAEVLERFRSAGLAISDLGNRPEEEAARATAEAIRSGADVIYQAVLTHDTGTAGTAQDTETAGTDEDTGAAGTDEDTGAAGVSAGQPALYGRPDFLVRAGLLDAPDGEPRPGAEHYEVVDAKLARSAKARAVAQTAFYSHLLASLQGVSPRRMHLALGTGVMEAFRVKDFAAY